MKIKVSFKGKTGTGSIMRRGNIQGLSKWYKLTDVDKEKGKVNQLDVVHLVLTCFVSLSVGSTINYQPLMLIKISFKVRLKYNMVFPQGVKR